MPAPITPAYTEYLVRCRACLGMCRHCLEETTPEEACHESLPDVILALEVATILIELRSEEAYDKLRSCAEACAFSATNWEEYAHPFTRQCASACRMVFDYWCANADTISTIC